MEKSNATARAPRAFVAASPLHQVPDAEAAAKPLRFLKDNFRIAHAPKTKAPRALDEGGANSSHSFSRRVCGGTDIALVRYVPGRPERSPDSRRVHGPASPSHPIPFLRAVVSPVNPHTGRISRARRSQWRDRGRFSRPSLVPRAGREPGCVKQKLMALPSADFSLRAWRSMEPAPPFCGPRSTSEP